MPKVFDITASPLTVNLDSKGQGEMVYTVTNVTGRKLRGRAGLDEKESAVVNKLAHIDGALERDFDVNGVHKFTVKIAAPPGSPEGKQTLKLYACLSDTTDEGDFGPTVAFTVPKVPVKPNGGGKAWIVIVVIVAVLLIGGGVTAFLLLRDGGGKTVKVPNLRGKTIEEATALLTARKLEMGSASQVLRGQDDVGKIVDQDPKDETEADPGSKVNVVLGKASAMVPDLVGKSYDDAQRLLQAVSLSTGKVSNQITGKAAGTVISQVPAALKQVSTDTPVDLVIEQASAEVPSLVSMPISRAVIELQNRKLRLGTVTGQFTDQAITAQNPAPGQRLPLGAEVNVTVPGRYIMWDRVFRDAMVQGAIKARRP